MKALEKAPSDLRELCRHLARVPASDAESRHLEPALRPILDMYVFALAGVEQARLDGRSRVWIGTPDAPCSCRSARADAPWAQGHGRERHHSDPAALPVCRALDSARRKR